MDKMLVDSLGDVVITNDGVTILKEMDIEHPAAKMIVEIAKTQDEEVGDGTTTAVVLAGELLKKSEELLDLDIHPTVIAPGYRLAATKAREVLDSLAYPVTIKDEDLLKKFAITAMTGKGPESVGDDAGRHRGQGRSRQSSTRTARSTWTTSRSRRRSAAPSEDSELIQGLVIDKERMHPNMPKTVKNAKIALLDTALEIKKTEIDAKIEITARTSSRLPRRGREDAEEHGRQDQETGANVVFCQKGVDDLVQHYLAKDRHLWPPAGSRKSDLKMLAKATGAKVRTSLDELTKEDLGIAGLVEERKIGDER